MSKKDSDTDVKGSIRVQNSCVQRDSNRLVATLILCKRMPLDMVTLGKFCIAPSLL